MKTRILILLFVVCSCTFSSCILLDDTVVRTVPVYETRYVVVPQTPSTYIYYSRPTRPPRSHAYHRPPAKPYPRPSYNHPAPPPPHHGSSGAPHGGNGTHTPRPNPPSNGHGGNGGHAPTPHHVTPHNANSSTHATSAPRSSAQSSARK